MEQCNAAMPPPRHIQQQAAATPRMPQSLKAMALCPSCCTHMYSSFSGPSFTHSHLLLLLVPQGAAGNGLECRLDIDVLLG